jgi:hypothetical protein
MVEQDLSHLVSFLSFLVDGDNGGEERERMETSKVKSDHVEREESKDAFMWMGASDKRKHTIRM